MKIFASDLFIVIITSNVWKRNHAVRSICHIRLVPRRVNKQKSVSRTAAYRESQFPELNQLLWKQFTTALT